MTTNRKRKPLDLFLEALVHPVRFRQPADSTTPVR
jgi:hypothetical protein